MVCGNVGPRRQITCVEERGEWGLFLHRFCVTKVGHENLATVWSKRGAHPRVEREGGGGKNDIGVKRKTLFAWEKLAEEGRGAQGGRRHCEGSG